MEYHALHRTKFTAPTTITSNSNRIWVSQAPCRRLALFYKFDAKGNSLNIRYVYRNCITRGKTL